MSELNFSAFEKALTSFEKAIENSSDEQFLSVLTDDQVKLIKAGVIQNFEFTYELSWKTLRRKLIVDEGESSITQLSRRDLFRLAAQKGLLDQPELWFQFHQARNLTSHTYDEQVAEDVYQAALGFLKPAQTLLNRMK